MTKPYRVLFWMGVSVLATAAIAAFVLEPLRSAFLANPVFNALIVGVLLIGIIINFRQVGGLFIELRWIQEFRGSNPEAPLVTVPRLLAPMARMLAQREGREFTLSALSGRSLLESIRSRLEESRDVSH